MANTRLKLGLDLNCLTGPKLTGVGMYAKELTKALSQLPDLDVTGYVKLSRYKKAGRVRERVPATPVSMYGLSEALGLKKIDVMHGLDFRVPKSTKFKKVVTVHDLVVFERSFNSTEQFEQGIENFNHMIQECKPDHIVTVSEFSRERLIHFFPEFTNRSTAIHLGSDHTAVIPGSKRIIEGDYIFSVGTIEKRKNTLGLVRAFELARKDLGKIKLVLAGHTGFEGDLVLDTIAKSPARSSIILLDYVDNESLRSLYEHARAFAFPSFYEGFGLPVIEAMKWGQPVLTSNCTSLPEVAGDAALLVDPNQIDEIAAGLVQLQNDDQLRTTLGQKAKLRSQLFSWKKCAQESSEVYRSNL